MRRVARIHVASQVHRFSAIGNAVMTTSSTLASTLRRCSTTTAAATSAGETPVAPVVAPAAVDGGGDAKLTPKTTQQRSDAKKAISLPPSFATLKKLNVSEVAEMSAFEVYRHLVGVLKHKRALEKFASTANSRARRAFAADLRRATIRSLPNAVVARALWRRMAQVIEERSISITQAAMIVSIPWPRIVNTDYKQASQLLAAWITDALQTSLPARVPPPATAATNEAPVETRTPTVTCLALAPAQARLLLRNLSKFLDAHKRLVGPLVTVAFQDLDTVNDAKKIISCLWSIEQAGTHAPDDIWRRAVRRLWDLNRERLIPVLDYELRSVNHFLTLGDEGAAAAAVPTPQKKKTVKKLRRGGTLKQKASDDVTTDDMSRVEDSEEGQGAEGADQAEKAIPKIVAHRGMTVREIFRLLRVLKREHWCGDVSALRGLANDALRIIARNDGALRSRSDGVPRSLMSITSRLKVVADLSPIEFLSLCVIAGELGIGFGRYLDAMDVTIFVPILTFHATFSDVVIISEMLMKTQCHNVAVFQALISRMYRQGMHNPLSIDLTLQVGKVIVSHNDLVHQLRFAPFMELLELVASQSIKMNARTIVSYTELIFQLTRRLSPNGPHASNLRKCVDEFAFQLDRLFANGVAPAEKVNLFLEHTVMLGMRKSPETYPHTQRLLARRNLLYTERKAKNLPFAGIVTGSPQTAQIYHKVYHLTKYMGWLRVRVPRKQIDELFQMGLESGLMPLFMGTKIVRDVHYRSRVLSLSSSPSTSKDENVKETDAATGDSDAAAPTAAAAAVVAPRKLVKVSRALAQPIPMYVDRVILTSILKCFERHNAPVKGAAFTPVYTQALHNILGIENVNATNYNTFVSAIDRAPLPRTKRHPLLWMYVRHLGMSLKIDEATQNKVDFISSKYVL